MMGSKGKIIGNFHRILSMAKLIDWIRIQMTVKMTINHDETAHFSQ
jgi:hypothetical protein